AFVRIKAKGESGNLFLIQKRNCWRLFLCNTNVQTKITILVPKAEARSSRICGVKVGLNRAVFVKELESFCFEDLWHSGIIFGNCRITSDKVLGDHSSE